MPKKLSRRTLLRGASGAAIGLPLLEAMMHSRGTALAQTAPKPNRFISLYGGYSLATSTTSATNPQAVVPSVVGRNYDLKTALKPFATHNVQGDVSVVSGLVVPWAKMNGGVVPPGGRSDNFHGSVESPLFTGSWYLKNESMDLIAARALGATTFRSFAYRVQATSYKPGQGVEGYGNDGRMSYQRLSDGTIQGVPPNCSPQQVFKSLFGTFISPDTTQAELERVRLERRKSVLDLVSQSREGLLARVGAADRMRLDQHFTEIRELEQRVAAIPPPTVGACSKPADPGPDPALGPDNYLANMGVDTTSVYANTSNCWSNETLRGHILSDLIRMAFACDLVRAGSLMLTSSGSALNMYAALNGNLERPSEVHGLTHGGSNYKNEMLARGIGWHMEQFAYLVARLRDTPEGTGTLLDRTALVYVNEGGWGYDPESGTALAPHSTENMAVFVAGRAGGLKPGQHIVATGKHPGCAVLSALNAVGVQSTTFGQVTGAIPQLFL
jgi:hypothetical protein